MAEYVRLDLRAGAASYPVVVGPGVVQQLPGLLEEVGQRGRLRIVADERVVELHGSAVRTALEQAGRSFAVLSISGREQDKNLSSVARVYDWLIDVGTDRSDSVLALGGGVVGDLVGFVAATYLRGVRLVHLPTTLLAMVDSSIGGKTGVDHPAGKNLVGAFHQPSLVVADLDTLKTLPRRELANGWAEVAKMGVIRSPELFERMESNPHLLERPAESVWEIARSIELKGEVVAADEREADLRMVLNYGHTIGHAIEAATGYKDYLHGEAVAIGMSGAAELAGRLGRFDLQGQGRQLELLRRLELPTACPGLSVERLRGPMGHDKKAVGARLRWVLPSCIGTAEVVDSVPDSLVDQVLVQLTSN